MALKVTTTIINMQEFSEESWIANAGSGSDWAALHEAQAAGTEVEVLCEAIDGYYDVQLPNGRLISALSCYHLEGFDVGGPQL